MRHLVMCSQLFLRHYLLSLDGNQLPLELHRSATAVSYAAKNAVTGRAVVLEMVTVPTVNDELLEQLQDEAAAARALQHPNIPALYDFGVQDGQLIYVREFFEGEPAVAWLSAHGPLSTAVVLRIGLQVADAIRVTALHDIAHHALHPDNIVLLTAQKASDAWPRIKILQWFGVAPIFGQSGDARLEFAACFASPEQLQTCRVDIASEVYSLGGTMWFLLTGAAPPPPCSVDEPGEPRLPWDSFRGLPRELRHLIWRMRSPEPEERPHDPVALAGLLEDCLARVEGRPTSTSAVAPQESERRARRRVRVGAITAAFLLLTLLGAATLSSRFGTGGSVRKEAHSATYRSSVVQEHHSRRENVSGFVRATPGRPRKNESSPVALSPRLQAPLPPEKDSPSVTATKPSDPADVEDDVEIAATSSVNIDSPEVTPASSPKPSHTTVRRKINKSDLHSSRALVRGSAQSNQPKSSPTRSRTIAKHQVKRAELIPKILVGLTSAELVGTTPEGQWILSVGDSGRKIVVSPPPGFGY